MSHLPHDREENRRPAAPEGRIPLPKIFALPHPQTAQLRAMGIDVKGNGIHRIRLVNGYSQVIESHIPANCRPSRPVPHTSSPATGPATSGWP